MLREIWHMPVLVPTHKLFTHVNLQIKLIRQGLQTFTLT